MKQYFGAQSLKPHRVARIVDLDDLFLGRETDPHSPRFLAGLNLNQVATNFLESIGKERQSKTSLAESPHNGSESCAIVAPFFYLPPPYFPCMAASISSAVCGSAASRSISLPSAPTRKSHSMRTPSFSSGM